MQIPKKSFLNSKLEVRETKNKGKGIFTKEPLVVDELILQWGGDYVNAATARSAMRTGSLVMQWDKDLFSVETRGEDPTYNINHSCDPNAWMQDAFTLVASRPIATGEEITADYALWESDESYVSAWVCACGTLYCRTRVRGDDWRSPTLQKRYGNHFSPLINKRIKQLPN